MPPNALRSALDTIARNLLLISTILLFLGSIGWCVLLYGQFRQSGLFAARPLVAMASPADRGGAVSDLTGSIARSEAGAGALAHISRAKDGAIHNAGVAALIAHDWSLFEPKFDADNAPLGMKAAKLAIAPPLQYASLDQVPPLPVRRPVPELAEPKLPANVETKTALVDFQTAPFPYHGVVPGTDHPFLDAGESGRRGHTNFRGRVLWESQTFADDHVLLSIPAGFDPKRPAVMVVFFHGHGATLARDVRDRQRLPAQIAAAHANAVLVAPQFAFDAADSSAGKFWEPDGFKRFLDEAAQKLARLYGDSRSQAAFARMPIVIVSYSGGFGPTLAVLARGGVDARIHGLVLLDSLYAGIDEFADWIADHRSTFFVSAYTPYTARHNDDLKRLLDTHSISYGSELRHGHLQGMVTFIPTGAISHRDFVTHAWADNPVEDILARMNDVNPRVQTAGVAVSPHH